jgi:CTD small phosphatase-like protein 2
MSENRIIIVTDYLSRRLSFANFEMFDNYMKLNKYNIDRIDNDKIEFDNDKKILILDLDGTLIWATFSTGISDSSFSIEHKEDQTFINVFMREYLLTFLQKVNELFNIVIWTASDKIYADSVLDMLERKSNVKLLYRLYRNNCSVLYFSNGNKYYIKDLASAKFDTHKTIIVDDISTGAIFNRNNYLYINRYEVNSCFDVMYNSDDSALITILNVLYKLANVENIEEYLIRNNQK